MTNKTIVSTRRQVLRGAGGFSLALPFLPSLVTPARSYAQAVPAKRKRFAAALIWHGGMHEADMYPLAAANQKMDMFAGHTINHGKLPRSVSGTTATISPVLTAAADKLTDAMTAKINIVRGLDNPFYFSHGGGVELGNVAGNDGFAGGDQLVAQKLPNVTIDQQMAWSPSYYAGGIPRQRYVYHFSHNGFYDQDHSYTWSSPASRSGNIVHTRTESDLGKIFDSLFMGGVGMPPAMPTAKRPLIVDRVVANFRNLRDGSSRISSLDKQRLTDYMDRLSELQRKLVAAQQQQASTPPAACVVPGKPTGTVALGSVVPSTFLGNNAVPHFKLYNDLIAAAFICDLTRISVGASIAGDDVLFPYSGDWHQDVAHQYFSPGPRALLKQYGQTWFEQVFLDLAVKLNVDEGDGTTILDNSLLLWSQEAGNETHVPLSIPVVTIGSAAGYFKTGNFVDYRRQTAAAYYKINRDMHYAGITYNRMMSTVLHSMGVDRAEWENKAKPGFGQTFIRPDATSRYSAEMLASASEPLPILT